MSSLSPTTPPINPTPLSCIPARSLPLSPIKHPLEVEVHLQDTPIKHPQETRPGVLIPLLVEDLEGDVLVGGAGSEADDDKLVVLAVCTGFQVISVINKGRKGGK